MVPVDGLAPVLLATLATGLVAGVIAGLLGVGGGIVIVPVLEYALGFAGVPTAWRMHVAVATSLATIIPTSISSTRAHHARGAVDWSLARAWAPGMLAGTLAGSLLAARLASAVLTAVFAVVALLAALKMFLPPERLQWAARPARGLAGSSIAAAIGAVSAMMGIGGGTVSVPVMSMSGESIHRAVATAAFFGLVISLPGTIVYLLARPAVPLPWLTVGLVSLAGVALIAPGSMLTAPLGARLAHALSRHALSRRCSPCSCCASRCACSSHPVQLRGRATMNDSLEPLPTDASACAVALATGRISARGLTEAYLAIAQRNPQLGAYWFVDASGARAAAAASDRRRAAGGALGPLDGIPLAIKVTVAVAGWPLTAGLRFRAASIAAADAPAIARLRAQGAVLLGVTSMDEGASRCRGCQPMVRHHPTSTAPRAFRGRLERGSGAAVAADPCAAALGTDTIGSLRIPAAFCGCASLKPSPGRVDNAGLCPCTCASITSVRRPAPCKTSSCCSARSPASLARPPHERPAARDRRERRARLRRRARRAVDHGRGHARLPGGSCDAAPPGCDARAVDLRRWDLPRLRAILALCEMQMEQHRERILTTPEDYSDGLRAFIRYGGRLRRGGWRRRGAAHRHVRARVARGERAIRRRAAAERGCASVPARRALPAQHRRSHGDRDRGRPARGVAAAAGASRSAAGGLQIGGHC
ncbi:MAG: TSUP family transporter [Steroidobacteraceae bacterium]